MKRIMMLMAVGLGFSIATVSAGTMGATTKTTSATGGKQHIHKTQPQTAEVAKAETKPQVTASKPVAAGKAKVAPVKATTNSTVLKKDGSPDKRYKATTASSGPKKADGSPDMRYKTSQKPQAKK